MNEMMADANDLNVDRFMPKLSLSSQDFCVELLSSDNLPDLVPRSGFDEDPGYVSDFEFQSLYDIMFDGD